MAKKKCNITGLRNQPKLTPSHIESTDVPPISNSDLPQSSDVQAADPDGRVVPKSTIWQLQTWMGCLRYEDDIDSEDEQDFLTVKKNSDPEWTSGGTGTIICILHLCALQFVLEMIPEMRIGYPRIFERSFEKRKQVCSHWIQDRHVSGWICSTDHPKKCIKGPDVGSKSKRTRRRYKDLLKDQQTLNSLGFTCEKRHQEDEESEMEDDQVNRCDHWSYCIW